MLEESLKWRTANRPESIRWPDVSVEAETGKMYRASFPDREGKTVVVMRPAKESLASLARNQKSQVQSGADPACLLPGQLPGLRCRRREGGAGGPAGVRVEQGGRLLEAVSLPGLAQSPGSANGYNVLVKFQNTSSHEGQLQYLVYTLENAILSLPEGQDKMVWLIDFTGWTLAHATPIKTARESMCVLENHYPERLAIAFLFNAPKVFEASFKVLKRLVDPKSVKKLNFVYKENEESMKTMYEHIDTEVLPVEFGGKSNVVYNHEEYSKLMTKDDIKTTRFWAADVNHVTNGHSVPEVTPQSSLLVAKAS